MPVMRRCSRRARRFSMSNSSERDDAINGLRPGNIAHGVKEIATEALRHGEDFVDAFEWHAAWRSFSRLGRRTRQPIACSANELMTLFVGTDAENGERPVLRHSSPLDTKRIEGGYTAVSRAGYRIAENGPTRCAQAASLCSAPSTRS